MNTIEVGSVVKLADELFYAIDSTRMASIEYGIVNSKGTHLSEVNHGGTVIEFAPLAYDPKLFKIVLRFYGKVSAHTISLLDDFIKGAYIVSSNLKIIKKKQSKASINILDMYGIICVKNLKFEQLLMRCGHLVHLFFPT